jgi:hypothetical protein
VVATIESGPIIDGHKAPPPLPPACTIAAAQLHAIDGTENTPDDIRNGSEATATAEPSKVFPRVRLSQNTPDNARNSSEATTTAEPSKVYPETTNYSLRALEFK